MIELIVEVLVFFAALGVGFECRDGFKTMKEQNDEIITLLRDIRDSLKKS